MMERIRIPNPMTVHEDPLARPPNETIRLDTWPRTSASPGYGVECYVQWLVRTVLPRFELHYELDFAWTEVSQGYGHVRTPLGGLIEPKSQLLDVFSFGYIYTQLLHDALEMCKILCMGMCSIFGIS